MPNPTENREKIGKNARGTDIAKKTGIAPCLMRFLYKGNTEYPVRFPSLLGLMK